MQNAFVFSDHVREVVLTGLLSMVPFFEGRYAVTTGIAMGMPVLFTFLLAYLCSSLPVPFVLFLFRPIVKWVYTLPIAPLRRFVAWVEARGMRKSQSVDAKGLIGLFLFVALPVPGTGIWMGSVIASLLEMNRGHAALAILAGNFVACLLMTLLSAGIFSFF